MEHAVNHFNFREVDQYGFERDEDFNYDSYAMFMSEYLSVLARRMAKWNKLMQDSSAIEKSNKGKSIQTVIFCFNTKFDV